MRPINRIQPAGSPAAYQTYRIHQTADTEVVQACVEAGCQAWRHGWQSGIDEATELGKRQAAFIRTQSGRTFREQRTAAGITVFRFDPGQRCFGEHRTKPVLYLVQGGDWRQHRGLIRAHVRPGDWVDDFANHQDAVARQIERG